MALWNNFCSSYPNSTDVNGSLVMYLTELQDFSECFHDLYHTAAAAALFLATLYLINRQKSVRARFRTPFQSSGPLNSGFLRAASAVFILAIIVIRQIILLSRASLRTKIGTAGYLHSGSEILAWSAILYHSIFLTRTGSTWRRNSSFAEYHLVLFLFWLPSLSASVFELWSAIGGVYSGLSITYAVSIYSLFCCQILVLISFLGPISRLETLSNQPGEGEGLMDQDHEEDEERPSIEAAYENAGIFSHIVVSWAGGLIRRGRSLKSAGDLFLLPKDLDFGERGLRFRRKVTADAKTSRIYLLRVFWTMWGGRWLFIGFLDFVSIIAQFASPIFLQKLVEFFEGDRADWSTGYSLAAGLLAMSLVSAVLHTHYSLLDGKLSISVTGVLIDSVYRKLFSVYGADLSSPGVSGKVVNLIGSDCGRVNDGLLNLHSLWLLPLEIAIALYLLYMQVGVAFLGGIGVTLVLLVANQLTVSRLVRYEEKKEAASDVRVKMIQEILNCIKVIKLHAWETFFQARVTQARRNELKYLRISSIFSGTIAAIWQTVPVGMAVTTFLIYVLMGHTLTAAKVFTSIALFRMLSDPLMSIAWVILNTIEMWVSVKRLQTFFKLPDLILSQLYDIVDENEPDDIRYQNAEFSAETSEEVFSSTESTSLLHDLTFAVQLGEFIGVTGRIGSGKTIFLNSLIGELHKTAGSLAIKQRLLTDGFGYAPQEPWILQGTIRENVLFGAGDIDLRRYQTVLECCALSTDLENLPNGDATEIGERGVTLSGGQKARLSLARAVYQNKDVILLDDPLAAVDPHVAAIIYTKCIRGLLRSKTRILVTHNIEGLRECDRVIVMKDGVIQAVGTPDEVLSLAEIEEAAPPSTKRKNSRQNSVRSHGSSVAGEEEVEDDETKEVAPLVDDEESETGLVKGSVYLSLFRAIGWPTVVIVCILAVLSQAAINGCDIWISYWVGLSNTNSSFNSTENARFFLSIYGAIAGTGALTSLTWPLLLFLGFLKASRILHGLLVGSVLKAKMYFFDSTPSGRILNRFSKDTNSVDSQLPLETLIFLAEICGVSGTLCVVMYSLPWFAGIVLPVSIVYYVIQSYYRNAARELKRLNSTTLSPLYSLYAETIQGLTTIRSMRAAERFCERFSRLLVTQQRVQFAMLGAEQWLELRLQLLGILLIAGVLLVGFLTLSQSESVGLALSYSLSIVGALISLIGAFIRFEKGMVNVERINQYIQDVEPEAFDGSLPTPPNWPSQGTIDFNQVCVRYRDDLPDVLDSIQLNILSGEKVGIVGRTGAGKSSLMLAIFRILEASSGSIAIDGVKIAQLKLQHLRSRLTIIPQTASLFDASIRDNLDPLQQYQDHEVWNAVEKCHLKPLVEKLGGTLASQVGDNGKNLSAGEKQLVSLARALLSNNKVVCLDEATANIDFETDMLVQKTIRECLADSTILTIAHRVQTVMDCDRVIVMSNGRISEEGAPGTLMSVPESRFYQMVQQSKSIAETR